MIINSLLRMCPFIPYHFTAVSMQPDVDRAEVLEAITSLKQKQAELRSILKKESQFNQKVELNMQIKKLNEQIEEQKTLLV